MAADTQTLDSVAIARKTGNPKRLFKIEWDGGVYWLKQPTRPKRPRVWPARLLKAAAWVLKLDIIKPTMRMGTLHDLHIEQARVAEWNRLGLPAPELVAHGDDWFLMRDCGTTLPFALPALDAAAQSAILQRTLETLQSVHARGACHGRPMIKDIALSPDGQITLLDFEETPLDVMNLEQAQARDLLVFLSSVPSELLTDHLVTHAVHKATPPVRQVIARCLRVLRPFIGALERSRHPMPRRMAQLARMLNESLSRPGDGRGPR